MTLFVTWVVLGAIASMLLGWTEGVNNAGKHKDRYDVAALAALFIVGLILPFLAIPFYAFCLARYYAE